MNERCGSMAAYRHPGPAALPTNRMFEVRARQDGAKPANVLLDHDWKVRLADFGQSRLSHEQLPALGTLFYMAPEQADLKATSFPVTK